MDEEKDYSHIIGMTPWEAQKVMPYGVYVVLAAEDGEGKILTAEFNPARLSVSVTDGKIDEVFGIG